MANRRMIAGDLFEDDFIGNLNYFERLLWIGLITTVADDQGRMMDNPALIRSKVFLFDTVTDSEVEQTLNKIGAAGKIVRYVSGNKSLIQIVNWWKYQTPAWASPSKYAGPAGWTDRAKYHATGNKIITSNWDKIGGYVESYVAVQYSTIEEGDVKGKGEDEAISAFEFTRKVIERETGLPGDGMNAVKAIDNLIANGCTEADIIAGIQWRKDEGKEITSYIQVVGPANTARLKRVQGAKSNGHNGQSKTTITRNADGTFNI